MRWLGAALRAWAPGSGGRLVGGLQRGLLGALLASVGFQGARHSGAGLGPQAAVPLFPSAQEQLDYARELKLSRRSLPVDQRGELSLRAVDAYRAVAQRFPHEVALAQEASFRSGRLLIAMGREEEALKDFFCLAHAGSAWGHRARMEIGHVHRRRRHWERAWSHYSQAADAPQGDLELRASAQLLRGDMCLRMGHIGAAQAAWRAVVKGSHDSRKRVLAFDRLARVEIEFGTTLRLAELLLECLEDLDSVVLEDSEQGRRARRALEQSRLVKTLATS